MILADTSVWIDHLREPDPAMQALLRRGQILIHPFITGELALGALRQRAIILGDLARLPQAVAASDLEVLKFVEMEKLFATGIGYLDAHVLAATRLTPDALFWTRDKRLRAAAERLGLASQFP